MLLSCGQASRGRLKEDEARKYFQHLINAVDYCHSRGVYHRDLKVSLPTSSLDPCRRVENEKLAIYYIAFLICSRRICCLMPMEFSKSPTLG